MEIEIYYFSTTGNSLVIARDIAQKIKGKLISILFTNTIRAVQINAGIVGIIFPVYHATFGEKGMPYLVEAFIRKLENIEGKYIFSICTHSGSPGNTLANVNKLLVERDGKLSAGVAVKLGNPYSTIEKLSHMLFNTPLIMDIARENERRKELVDQCKRKTDQLCKAILRRQELPINEAGIISKYINYWFLSLQRKMAIGRYQQLSKLQITDFRELVKHADNSFTVSSQCNACGICQKVCPVDNIEMANNRPKWLNRCENCYACFQWCPQEAIAGKIVEFEKRYHQPDIRLADMMNRS